MSDKNIDGIKKLNEDEIKKSRKILLDYIGEEDRKASKKLKKSEKLFTATKRKEKAVDGLVIKKEAVATPPELPKEINPIIETKKIKQAPSEEEKEVLKNELEKNEPKIELELKETDEKTVSKLEKVKKPKKKSLTKKQEAIKKKRQKIKEAKERVEKKKKKIKAKRKVKKKGKKKLKQLTFNFKFLDKLISHIKVIGNNIVLIIVSSIIFIVVFYFIHAIFLLKFNIDSNFSRKISSVIPVPAVITDNGYIEYFDYKDLIVSTKDNQKSSIIKKIVLLDLMNRYDVSQTIGAENIIKEINNNLLFDTKINPSALSLDEYLDNKLANKKIWFLTN